MSCFSTWNISNFLPGLPGSFYPDNDDMYKLGNVIQNYAWGSKTAMTALFGITNPDDQPQAELWMGAHPNGCSRIVCEGESQLLSDVIEQSPETVLGRYTHDKFGELPYLVKVLSAAKHYLFRYTRKNQPPKKVPSREPCRYPT